MATLLVKSDGKNIKDGATSEITIVLKDYDAASLTKAAILTLTATLKDEDGAVINGRSDQTVLDANGGSVASNGTLTLLLSTTDNAYQGTGNDVEYHYLRIEWTWSDGTNTHTGAEDWILPIEPLPV